MRVAVFVGCFPLVSETFILRQITGLIDLGHEVDIFSDNRPWGDGPVHPDVQRYGLLARTTYMDLPPEAEMELPVWPLTGASWLPGAEAPTRNASRLLRALPMLAASALAAPGMTADALRPSRYGFRAASLSTAYRMAALRRVRRKYDVLHAQFGTVGDIFRFARAMWRAPLVVSFRGHDYSRWPRAQGREVYRWLFRSVDAVTINTDFARMRVEALGCPPSLIHKIPSAIDPGEFEFRERRRRPGERLRVLTVGRLVEMKGIEYGIRAVARLAEHHPGVHFDVVGDGPLRAELEKLTRELGAERRVTFHGARPIGYVRQMMDEAHLFMLTSVTASNGDEESLGNVLVEAQAAGLPVIATAHNGFPETIAPGRSGYLVPERDVDSLAERLDHLANHPGEWPGLGRAGRAHVEQHYDARVVVRRLAALYADVSARRGAGAPG